MLISELAARTGNTPQTIRYYESIGLLPPPVRASNNYRQYGAEHEARLDFIRHCRHLDISIEEIRTLLAALENGSPEGAADAHRLIGKHLTEIDERIADLQELKGHLLALSAHCRGRHQPGETCGILTALCAKPDDCEDCASLEHRDCAEASLHRKCKTAPAR